MKQGDRVSSTISRGVAALLALPVVALAHESASVQDLCDVNERTHLISLVGILTLGNEIYGAANLLGTRRPDLACKMFEEAMTMLGTLPRLESRLSDSCAELWDLVEGGRISELTYRVNRGIGDSC